MIAPAVVLMQVVSAVSFWAFQMFRADVQHVRRFEEALQTSFSLESQCSRSAVLLANHEHAEGLLPEDPSILISIDFGASPSAQRQTAPAITFSEPWNE
eukprot:ANDGO_05275.mRNA.1 hypothetical protein